MVGSSNVGLFNKDDYGLRGVGIVLLTGFVVESHLIKRFRIFNRRKTNKVFIQCKKWHEKYAKGAGFLFFPPGVGFPK